MGPLKSQGHEMSASVTGTCTYWMSSYKAFSAFTKTMTMVIWPLDSFELVADGHTIADVQAAGDLLEAVGPGFRN